MPPTPPSHLADSRRATNPAALATAYAVMLATACCLEAIWYLGIAESTYERELKGLLVAQFGLAPAAAFYAFYALGASYFALAPALRQNSLWIAAGRGGAYGFFCFSAHNFTDLADIQGYSAFIVSIDIPWGVFMSTVSCTLAFVAARRLQHGQTASATHHQ